MKGQRDVKKYSSNVKMGFSGKRVRLGIFAIIGTGLFALQAHLNASLSPPVQVKPVKTHYVPLPKTQHTLPIPSPAVPIPAMKTQPVLQQTDFVGTEDHPTLDGGMINSADGVPIHHVELLSPLPHSLLTKSHPLKNTTQDTDAWFDSEKVKRLLEKAAEGGKLSYVLEKAHALSLPASMATVPMIESHYQTTAVSEKGAAGAWQLMPSLAKYYQISNNDRFDFQKSTDVALNYLTHLNKRFGRWDYALAAYHAGEKRVQEAILNNPNASSVEELDLPLETKHYVKQLQGLNQQLEKEE